MSPEWVTAIASIGTFVVIGGSAIAALVQLRHLRISNQLAALNDFRKALETQYFRDAAQFSLSTLPKVLDDSSIRQRIANGTPLRAIPELTEALMLANFFETFGLLVKAGMVDRRLACDLLGGPVLRYWDALAALIANVRAAQDIPATWENFEYLAVISRQFDDAHPEGTYPPGLGRAATPPLWPEVLSKINRARD